MLQKLSGETNAINWFEIPVEDIERGKRFYEKVLDIELVVPPSEDTDEEMALFPRLPDTIMGLSGKVSGALVKGKLRKTGQSGVLIYLNASPSIQPAIDRVESAGGKIIVNRTQIPAGFIAVILDTEGNQVGLHAAE